MNPFFKFFAVIFSTIAAAILSYMACESFLIGTQVILRIAATNWHIDIEANPNKCFENIKLTKTNNPHFQSTTNFCKKDKTQYNPPYPVIYSNDFSFYFTLPHFVLEITEQATPPVYYDIDFNECLRKSPNFFHELWNIKDDADITILLLGGDQIQISKTRRDYRYGGGISRNVDFSFICSDTLKPRPASNPQPTFPTNAPKP